MKTEVDSQPDPSKICRTCTKSGPPDSLLPIGGELEEDATIASVIGELTATQIRLKDGLPEGICADCVDELRRFVEFIRKVRVSDRKLRRMFLKGGKKTAAVGGGEEAVGEEKTQVKVEVEPWNCKQELMVDDTVQQEEVLEEVVVEEEYLEMEEDGVWNFEQREEEEPSRMASTVSGNSQIEFVGFDDPKPETKPEPSAPAPDLTVRGKVRKRKFHRYNKNPNKPDYTVLDEVEQQIYLTLDMAEGDFLCCACYKIFSCEEEFKDHCEEHGKKSRLNVLRPYVCEICFKRYTTAQGLELHMKQAQAADKVYECTRCKARFLNTKTRRQHAHEHPQVEVIESTVLAPIRVQPNHRKGRICCAQGCRESFPTDEALIEHAQEAHRLNRMAATLPEYQDKPFECPVCYKRFYEQSTLISHQKRKYKSPLRQCSICGAKFPGGNALAAHERQHTGEKPFPCSICHKSFASPTLLKCHAIVHSKEKTFMCPTCGRGFNRKATLQKHELIHANLSVFDCEVCGKPFRTRSRLDLHMRTHSGFKPYPCRYCEKAFADFSNRSRHEMGHTGIKPHKCSQCEKTFITRRLLAEHERSNHSIATVYTCEICCEAFTNRASLTKHLTLHEENVEDEDAAAVVEIIS